MELRCLKCSKVLVWSGRGRPPKKYCSAKCKDADQTASRARRRIEARLERTCPNCGLTLPAEKFGKAQCCSKACSVTWQNRKRALAKQAARQGRHCQQCGKAIPDTMRAHAMYCSERCQQIAVQRRRRDDGRTRAYFLNRLYGLSMEQYETMLAAQGGRCAICRTDQPGGKGGWHVDHCHDTGQVRGLLCHNCNVGIGNFAHDPARLRAAVAYLNGEARRPSLARSQG